jgi:hypothetical protein
MIIENNISKEPLVVSDGLDVWEDYGELDDESKMSRRIDKVFKKEL